MPDDVFDPVIFAEDLRRTGGALTDLGAEMQKLVRISRESVVNKGILSQT